MVPDISDRAWSWFVLFGSFLIHVIMAGLLYSFGTFYIAFLDYFHGSKSDTSWIGSILTASLQISGPITSLFINRFGCRFVTIAGAILASIGFISTTFVSKTYWLHLTFGIIPGLGYSLMYIPAIVAVSQFFKDKRSLAFGISSCGTIILIDIYSFRGALLIEAGLLLNCVVAGALFRPLRNTKKHTLKDCESKIVEANFSKQQKPLISDCSQEDIPTNKLTVQQTDAKFNLNESNNDTLKMLLHDKINARDQCGNKIDDCTTTECTSYNKGNNITGHNECEFQILLQTQLNQDNDLSSKTKAYRNNSTDELSSNNDKKKCCNSVFSIIFKINTSLGFNNCKEVHFFLLVCSNCLIELGTMIVYTYLPDRSKESGIGNMKASLLLSVAGASNLVARILFGWLADKTWTNSSYIFSAVRILFGICTLFLPIVNSYIILMCYATCFGITVGTSKCLSTVILVEFMGVDKLTSAFGVVQMFKGIFVLFGIPVAGWLYDRTSSYSVSFYLAGILVILSSISMMLGFIAKRASLKADKAILQN